MVDRLSNEEVEDNWAIECPVFALYMSDELLEIAIGQRRVAFAYSTSSMGSADTRWAIVSSLREIERWREDVVAWPEGHVFSESDLESYDDRDVYAVLWKWYFRTLVSRAMQAIPRESYDVVLDEYARVLVVLEQLWMRGETARDGWLTLLQRHHVEPSELDAILAEKGSATRHLRTGLRARWIRRDPAELYRACITSIERFGNTRRAPLTRAELHHELVQVAVRVARGRAWRGVSLP